MRLPFRSRSSLPTVATLAFLEVTSTLMPPATITLFFLAAAFLVLVVGSAQVGYVLPPSSLVVGASGEVGFNNTLAYLWYLAVLPVPAVLAARLMRVTGSRPSPDLRMRAWPTLSKWLFAIASAAHVIAFAAIYLYKGRLPFSEGIFFQAQLHRMTMGERPYLDFAYYYGPTMIYPPYWLTLALPLEAAYAVGFIASYIVGIYLLFALVHAFMGTSRASAWWSAFLTVGLFDIGTGLNASLVRYLLPLVVLLLTYDLLGSGRSRSFLLTAVALTFGLLLSFEVAVLCALAVGLSITLHPTHRYVRSLLRETRGRIGASGGDANLADHGPGSRVVVARGLSLTALAVALSLVFFWAIDPSWRALRLYPESALAFLSGAYNLPVDLALPFLVLAAITVVALGGLLRLLALPDPSWRLPLIATFAVVALVAQRKIFAATDPLNVGFFSLPTLLVCLLVTRHLRHAQRITQALGLAVLVGIMFPFQLYYASQVFPAAWPFSAAASASGGTGDVRRPAGPSVESTLVGIVEHVGRDRPYLMYGLEYYSVPIYHRLGLRYPNYFTNLTSVSTPAVVARAIDETRRSDAIVVISRSDLSMPREEPFVSPGLDRLAQATGTILPGSRLRGVLYRNESRLLTPFLEFIRREYREIYELNGIVALERTN